MRTNLGKGSVLCAELMPYAPTALYFVVNTKQRLPFWGDAFEREASEKREDNITEYFALHKHAMDR